MDTTLFDPALFAQNHPFEAQAFAALAHVEQLSPQHQQALQDYLCGDTLAPTHADDACTALLALHAAHGPRTPDPLFPAPPSGQLSARFMVPLLLWSTTQPWVSSVNMAGTFERWLDGSPQEPVAGNQHMLSMLHTASFLPQVAGIAMPQPWSHGLFNIALAFADFSIYEHSPTEAAALCIAMGQCIDRMNQASSNGVDMVLTRVWTREVQQTHDTHHGSMAFVMPLLQSALSPLLRQWVLGFVRKDMWLDPANVPCITSALPSDEQVRYPLLPWISNSFEGKEHLAGRHNEILMATYCPKMYATVSMFATPENWVYRPQMRNLVALLATKMEPSLPLPEDLEESTQPGQSTSS